MPESIYIETTIPSLLTARLSLRQVEATRQELTREWWMMHRANYRLVTSEVVLEEANDGDAEMAKARLEILAQAEMLRSTPVVPVLAEAFISGGVLPIFAERDAAHIAYATVHRVDYLLTWNCKHIANANIQKRLRMIAAKFNLELPTICTPEELLYDHDDYTHQSRGQGHLC
jgi:hypothetical protein